MLKKNVLKIIIVILLFIVLIEISNCEVIKYVGFKNFLENTKEEYEKYQDFFNKENWKPKKIPSYDDDVIVLGQKGGGFRLNINGSQPITVKTLLIEDLFVYINSESSLSVRKLFKHENLIYVEKPITLLPGCKEEIDSRGFLIFVKKHKVSSILILLALSVVILILILTFIFIKLKKNRIKKEKIKFQTEELINSINRIYNNCNSDSDNDNDNDNENESNEMVKLSKSNINDQQTTESKEINGSYILI